MLTVLEIALTSLGSVVALFLLTKIIGNRQMSQMSMFDYINGITIGGIGAEFATSLQGDFIKPLTAMIVYALAAVGISLISCKSMKLRRLLGGRPVILYENGKLYEKNMFYAKLDINEFLTQCRVGGYFDLNDLQTVILETNGQFSFLPVAKSRPLTPGDLQITPEPAAPVIALILDGVVLTDNLRHSGNNDVWLQNQLEAQGVHQVHQVFLATCDAQNVLTVYLKTGKQLKRDMFE